MLPQIGPLEIIVVGAVALIVFGPHRLPEIARTIGRTLNELKRQASDIRAEFEGGLDVDDEPEPDPSAEPSPSTHPPGNRDPSAEHPPSAHRPANPAASAEPSPSTHPPENRS